VTHRERNSPFLAQSTGYFHCSNHVCKAPHCLWHSVVAQAEHRSFREARLCQKLLKPTATGHSLGISTVEPKRWNTNVLYWNPGLASIGGCSALKLVSKSRSRNWRMNEVEMEDSTCIPRNVWDSPQRQKKDCDFKELKFPQELKRNS
jgi:hypothetical protein